MINVCLSNGVCLKMMTKCVQAVNDNSGRGSRRSVKYGGGLGWPCAAQAAP